MTRRLIQSEPNHNNDGLTCDIDRIADRVTQLILAQMPMMKGRSPMCIRCGEIATIIPFQIRFFPNGKVVLHADPDADEYQREKDKLQFLTTGWYCLNEYKGEWLCKECKEQIHKIGPRNE